MKKYNIGILGVTGAVGMEILKILEEKNFPIENLRIFASKKSAGKKINFKDKSYEIEEAKVGIYKGIDILFGAVGNEQAKTFIPSAVENGAIVIDNSSAYRLVSDVPLIVPEINPEAILQHKGIIANPNCATIIGLTAVNELNKFSKIKKMIVSTYQAVSGAGNKGITELNAQIESINHNAPLPIETFPYQIAYNLIPQIGDFDENFYSSEEMKFQNEGRKILNNPELMVNCTCVRVPVYRSHSESITLEFEDKIDVNIAKNLLSKASGVRLLDSPKDKIYPMPLDTTNQDLIYVGRVRQDITNSCGKGLVLWCCGDQVRKGAATNAVQIAELLIQKQLI